MALHAYNDEEIQQALATVKDWKVNSNGELEKQFRFGNFVQAMAFLNKVATVAEEMQHHPDMWINYNRVTLMLITHDVKGVSENDFKLAQRADELAE